MRQRLFRFLMLSTYLAKMDDIICLENLEEYAQKTLPKYAMDYYSCGSGSEQTLKENRKQFSRYRIRPRVLRNVTIRNLSTIVLGEKVTMPIGISPVAMQKMAHPDGECASALAAQEMGTIFILSSLSTCSIEEVASVAPLAIKWFQLYALKNRASTIDLIKRVEKAGFKAIVLTVDSSIAIRKRANHYNKFSLPTHLRFGNFLDSDIKNENGVRISVNELIQFGLDWNEVAWFQGITTLSIILKGILTSEDALKAASLNVPAIIISNHGGRQLDTAPSTLEALKEIAKVADKKLEIYMDGGVREGIDVFKALALGAQMVFVGRPVVWGLVYQGKEGVHKMMNVLKTELDETLALSGCSSLQDISREMVVHKSFYYNI